jgi:putative ABC transport system substrate-binding protein
MTLVAGCAHPFVRSSPRSRTHRIGFLASGSLESAAPSIDALREGLRELGYVELQNLVFEFRAADGQAERLPDLAAELVRLNVEVIVTGGREAIRAARQATSSTPIVFAATSDPVAEQFVDSLAHPGGNSTGLTLEAGDEDGKRVELLKEAAPGISRLGIVWSDRVTREFNKADAAARVLGLQVASLQLARPELLEALFESATDARADGLLVIADALFMPLATRIVEFAVKHRVPAMYPTTTYVRAGGLMAYGASIPGNYRRAATYVDAILRGASPSSLPVERPAKYEFVINLKAAQAIGLSLPASLLIQSTQVID